MLFDEDFLDTLANDPIAGTNLHLLHNFQVACIWTRVGGEDYENLLKACTLFSEMAGARVLPVNNKYLTFAPSIDADKKMLR